MTLFGKEFAPQELALGAIAHTPLFAKLPPLQAGIICAISAVLWMLGGTFKKAIRRFGVPLVPLIFAGLSWPALAAPVIGVALLHIGDGFPDRRPTTKDGGRWLGRQVEKYIDDRDYIGGPITKFLAVCIYALSLIPYFL